MSLCPQPSGSSRPGSASVPMQPKSRSTNRQACEQPIAHRARWDGTQIYVQVDESGGRLPGQGVWVKPVDVYQATPVGDRSERRPG